MKNWTSVAIALTVTGAALQIAGTVGRNRRAPLRTPEDPQVRVMGLSVTSTSSNVTVSSVWIQLRHPDGRIFDTNIYLR